MTSLITQIGSLPYDNVKKAVEYSLKHDIPFLPELPILGDSMTEYIKAPGTLSCLDEFVSNSFDTVKIQCVGPVSLLQMGYSEDEAVILPYEHIDSIMSRINAKEVILFLDEAALGHYGGDFWRLWEPLFSSFDVVKGVHVCGAMDWDRLFNSPIDMMSFDASKYDLTGYAGYRSDKRISWGVKSLQDIRDFHEGDIITPPCGLSPGFYKEDDCKGVLDLLQGIAGSF